MCFLYSCSVAFIRLSSDEMPGNLLWCDNDSPEVNKPDQSATDTQTGVLVGV